MPVLTPPKGEKMPRTLENLEARALRDQELILEQKEKLEALVKQNRKMETKLIKARESLKELRDDVESLKKIMMPAQIKSWENRKGDDSE